MKTFQTLKNLLSAECDLSYRPQAIVNDDPTQRAAYVCT